VKRVYCARVVEPGIEVFKQAIELSADHPKVGRSKKWKVVGSNLLRFWRSGLETRRVSRRM
jgi:hypothetical protein